MSCYSQKGTAGLKSGDYVAVIRECESRGIQEDADSWESIKKIKSLLVTKGIIDSINDKIKKVRGSETKKVVEKRCRTVDTFQMELHKAIFILSFLSGSVI